MKFTMMIQTQRFYGQFYDEEDFKKQKSVPVYPKKLDFRKLDKISYHHESPSITHVSLSSPNSSPNSSPSIVTSWAPSLSLETLPSPPQIKIASLDQMMFYWKTWQLKLKELTHDFVTGKTTSEFYKKWTKKFFAHIFSKSPIKTSLDFMEKLSSTKNEKEIWKLLKSHNEITKNRWNFFTI